MTDHIGAICRHSRRSFLGTALSCSGYLLFALAGVPRSARAAFAGTPHGETLRTEPFARVERVGDGLWAVVSTPFAGGTDSPQGTTFSNGGIIAGSKGVLVIEGFMTPAGAAWQSDVALELTGRRPTHVVVTHCHPDHCRGLAGYQQGAEGPDIIATVETRRLLIERLAAPFENVEGTGTGLAGAGRILTPDHVIADTDRPTEIDLGGRVVRLVPRVGHTLSDLTIEIDDPPVVWCGDLVFYELFPNYADALPSTLRETCRDLLIDPEAIYIPGHGSVSDQAGLQTYLAMLDHVEAAARDFHAQGVPAREAWERYEIPASLGEWVKYRPDVYRFAFQAWEAELSG